MVHGHGLRVSYAHSHHFMHALLHPGQTFVIWCGWCHGPRVRGTGTWRRPYRIGTHTDEVRGRSGAEGAGFGAMVVVLFAGWGVSNRCGDGIGGPAVSTQHEKAIGAAHGNRSEAARMNGVVTRPPSPLRRARDLTVAAAGAMLRDLDSDADLELLAELAAHAGEERCVTALATALERDRSQISRQLNRLKQRCLVAARGAHKFHFYRLGDGVRVRFDGAWLHIEVDTPTCRVRLAVSAVAVAASRIAGGAATTSPASASASSASPIDPAAMAEPKVRARPRGGVRN